MFSAELQDANQSENTVEQELNTETTEKVPSENQHTTDCATDTVDLAARGGEAESESATRGGCVDNGCEMETDTESDTDTESETETADEQSIVDAAQNLVNNAKRLGYNQELLSKKNRNITFNRVVHDRRYREAQSLICCSDDVMATYDIETGQTNFHLRDPGDINLNFWHFWPEVDGDGAYKEMIVKTRMKMKEIVNRIRETT